MQDKSRVIIPPKLALIAGNRDDITLNEFAEYKTVKPQTVRRNLCTHGECYGVVPIKSGKKWLFSVQKIAEAGGTV
jgi:hypothetical protein